MYQSANIERVVLIGAPNSGKTTLFNWMTRSRFRAVNYPGSTVDCYRGRTHPSYGRSLDILDTPGVYGVSSQSADEEVTLNILQKKSELGNIDFVVFCLDATQLRRQLPMALKVAQMGWPMVLALTMSDLVEKKKFQIDFKKLESVLGSKLYLIDGKTGRGVDQLISGLHKTPLQEVSLVAMDQLMSQRECTEKVDQILKSVTQSLDFEWQSDLWDQVLLHPVWGLVSFFLIMATLFTSVFWLAAPLMDWIDSLFSMLGSGIHQIAGQGLWVDFVADGVVASLASVIVFLPQIFILFFLMGILEDSGYLARAATLVDKPLSMLGLGGRSFVPLLSGYACAVPAIMATRTITSKKERRLAQAMIPLLSCSARLPVYSLLLAFLVGESSPFLAGLLLTLIYIVSGVIGAIATWGLNLLLPKTEKSSFVLELPLYRRPSLRLVMMHALVKCGSYVRKAGPIIFVLALVLWWSSHFPRNEIISGADKTPVAQNISESYLGQMGQKIEPLFKPMGIDWKVGVGLISAFAAREVFVSSMALVYDVSTEETEGIQEGVLAKMKAATWPNGDPIFRVGTIIGLIAFFMIALQCSSTVGIVLRETQSWTFTLAQLFGFNLVAYLVAVIFAQF